MSEGNYFQVLKWKVELGLYLKLVRNKVIENIFGWGGLYRRLGSI